MEKKFRCTECPQGRWFLRFATDDEFIAHYQQVHGDHETGWFDLLINDSATVAALAPAPAPVAIIFDVGGEDKAEAAKNKQKEVIKKYLPKKNLDDFTQNLLTTCLNILDHLPETDNEICDLLTAATQRNDPHFHIKLLDHMGKEIFSSIQYLIEILVEGDCEDYEQSNKKKSKEKSDKLVVKIHLFAHLFFQGQRQDMKVSCANALKEVVSSCVQLMAHQQLGPATLHAIMRVIVRLTKNYNIAEVFARYGGIDVLLNMKQSSSGYTELTTLATLLIRHVIEEPKTLSLAIQNVLANRTLTTIPPEHRELLFLIRQLNSAVYRDPQLFKEAAKVLRVDFESMERLAIPDEIPDEKRFIMKSVPVKYIYKIEQETEMTAVTKLLEALVEPDETLAETPDPSHEAQASNSENSKDKPLLSKSAILKILAESVKSYQNVALYITEYKYRAGISSRNHEETSFLAFLLNHMFYLNDFELPAMTRSLISAIASSDVTQAQETVVQEVKLALQRALNEPETEEKNLHIKGLATLIPAMIENNQSQSFYDILSFMIEKGIGYDIISAVHFLVLGHHSTTDLIIHLLKPLEVIAHSNKDEGDQQNNILRENVELMNVQMNEESSSDLCLRWWQKESEILGPVSNSDICMEIRDDLIGDLDFSPHYSPNNHKIKAQFVLEDDNDSGTETVDEDFYLDPFPSGSDAAAGSGRYSSAAQLHQTLQKPPNINFKFGSGKPARWRAYKDAEKYMQFIESPEYAAYCEKLEKEILETGFPSFAVFHEPPFLVHVNSAISALLTLTRMEALEILLKYMNEAKMWGSHWIVGEPSGTYKSVTAPNGRQFTLHRLPLLLHYGREIFVTTCYHEDENGVGVKNVNDASHIFHCKCCFNIAHLIIESRSDNLNRNKCVAQKKCVCGLIPKCEFDEFFWDVLHPLTQSLTQSLKQSKNARVNQQIDQQDENPLFSFL